MPELYLLFPLSILLAYNDFGNLAEKLCSNKVSGISFER
jgi:hypothetical protein